jgi:hypothetical protein
VTRISVCLFLLAFATVPRGYTQAGSGSIQGIVTDRTGAVVPRASVTIRNQATNVARDVTTNGDGVYVAPSLQPGTYEITVERAGFSIAHQAGVLLRVDDKLAVNFTLEVGATSTRVEITAAAPLVNEINPSLGLVVDDRRISDLPLDGREPFSLAALSPGVIPVPASANIHQGGALPGINGTSNGTSAAMVDGAQDSTNVVGGHNMQLIYTPPVDAVAEFKVETNALSAEYGRFNGGVISLVTKGGGNRLHGSLYEYLRNSLMDANEFFNNRSGIPLTSLKRNQFGVTAGGPVVLPKLYHGRNRTFFFMDYEGFRQSLGTSSNFTVPTAQQRQGDFSRTTTSGGQLVAIYNPFSAQTVNGAQTRSPFPGNVIPQNLLNPVALNLQKFYPQPNNTRLTSNFQVAPAVYNANNSGGARIDHNFTDRHRIFGRFSIQYPDTGAANFYGNIANFGAPPLRQRRYHDSLQDVYTITPTVIVNVNYGFFRQFGTRQSLSEGFDNTSLGFNPNFHAGQQIQAIPLISITGYSGLGNASQNAGAQMGHSVAGSVTKVAGRHTIKTGSEFRLYIENGYPNVATNGSLSFANTYTQGPNPFQASATAGNAYAAFLLGIPGGSIINQPALGSINRYAAFYFQDDWKVTPKLTVNLGLRYDLNFPRYERWNRMSRFNLTARSPIAGKVAQFPDLKGAMEYVDSDHRAYADLDTRGIGPRIGLAWRVLPATVVRAGYGIFYGLSPTAAVLTQGGFTDGFGNTTNIVTSLDGATPLVSLSNPFPSGITPPAGRAQLSPASLLGQSINSVNIGQATPYFQNWNFSLQRGIGSRILLQAAYAANKGTRLPLSGTLDVNALTEAQYRLGAVNNQLVPNPFSGVITDATSPLSLPTVSRGQLLKPYPQYTALNAIFATRGNSIYHSLQASAEKRFSLGFSVHAAYTAGKMIDDSSQAASGARAAVQDPTNLRAERTIDPQDISQRLVVSGMFELPIGRGRHFGAHMARPLDALAGGWQVNVIATAQTGAPLLLTSIGATRPNVVGATAPTSGAIQSRLSRYFDTSAYAVPPAFTYGNSTPTAPNLRAPGIANCDLSLFKGFQIVERLRAQMRLEAFNAMNRVQFSAPNTQTGAAGFGVIGSQVNRARQLQVALRLVF